MLLGDVFLGGFLTLIADRTGRRKVLIGGSVLMVSSGVVFAYFDNFWILLISAIFGVISVTGGDFGKASLSILLREAKLTADVVHRSLPKYRRIYSITSNNTSDQVSHIEYMAYHETVDNLVAVRNLARLRLNMGQGRCTRVVCYLLDLRKCSR